MLRPRICKLTYISYLQEDLVTAVKSFLPHMLQMTYQNAAQQMVLQLIFSLLIE